MKDRLTIEFTGNIADITKWLDLHLGKQVNVNYGHKTYRWNIRYRDAHLWCTHEEIVG